ncbi:hypothetical protein [Sagittula sp. S175]|uniref:hypothetical protein n=1 Tax=Sagittula sp. S175 TaxID=3415129 RepID=UPI003C7D3D0C
MTYAQLHSLLGRYALHVAQHTGGDHTDTASVFLSDDDRKAVYEAGNRAEKLMKVAGE